MEWLKHTLFINLDYRVDRREHAMEEFATLGIENTVERFPAIRTTAGNVGCTMSHIKCLEIAIKRNYPHIFICEDDIHFTNPQLFQENLTKLYNDQIPWDVLVVGGNNCPPYSKINDYCVRVFNIQTTTGYIVKQCYYETLLANFKEGVKLLLRNPDMKKQYSIDIYWKSLQMTHQWLVLIPLTVTQYEDYSDIEDRQVNYSSMMLDLDKAALIQMMQQQHQRHPTMKML